MASAASGSAPRTISEGPPFHKREHMREPWNPHADWKIGRLRSDQACYHTVCGAGVNANAIVLAECDRRPAIGAPGMERDAGGGRTRRGR